MPRKCGWSCPRSCPGNPADVRLTSATADPFDPTKHVCCASSTDLGDRPVQPGRFGVYLRDGDRTGHEWVRAVTTDTDERAWRASTRSSALCLDASEDDPNCRRPPLFAALRGRDAVGVEITCDLAETLACTVVDDNSPCDLLRGRWPAGDWFRAYPRTWRAPTLGHKSLELVDGNELGAPRHLYRLDPRQHAATERRRAHPKRFGRLRPRVGQPLDVARRSHGWRRDGSRDGRGLGHPVLHCRVGVPLGFRVLAAETASRHPYTVHRL